MYEQDYTDISSFLHYRLKVILGVSRLQTRDRALRMHDHLPVNCVDCWKTLWVYMHSDECMLVDAHVLCCPLWMAHFTLQTK